MTPEDAAKKAEIARIVAAYKDLFDDPQKKGSAEIVMADLHKVAYMEESGWHPDVGYMQHITGRREVFLHIGQMIGLTADQIDRIMLVRGQLTEPGEKAYDPLRGNT